MVLLRQPDGVSGAVVAAVLAAGDGAGGAVSEPELPWRDRVPMSCHS